MEISKDGLRRFLRRHRFEVRRIHDEGMGRDWWRDSKLWCRSTSPIIFDVGANEGQTATQALRHYPHGEIHSFEPGDHAYQVLHNHFGSHSRCHLNKVALGARAEVQTFREHSASDMSSLLQPGAENWAHVTREIPMTLDTIDNYCETHGVSHIHILKTDTQGYDLQVLRGAEKMIVRGHVQLIFMEIIFNELYQNSARLDEIFAYLSAHGFSLVSFYQIYHKGHRAAWTDGLFVNPNFNNR